MAKLYLSSIRSLDLSDNYDRAYSVVSIDRKEKAASFKNEESRKRTIMGEILIRKALSDLNRKYDMFEYAYGKYGKPYLKNMPDFCFNISHSGDYVLLGVSGKEIGCDIELIRKRDLKIAKRFFTAQEYEDIIRVKNEDDRMSLFFSYWVLKESYIKQSGLGLSEPLNSFSITINENKEIYVNSGNDVDGLYMKLFDELEGYRIGVCSYDEEAKLKVVDFTELMKEGIL